MSQVGSGSGTVESRVRSAYCCVKDYQNISVGVVIVVFRRLDLVIVRVSGNVRSALGLISG